jgi:hypothetical protein
MILGCPSSVARDGPLAAQVGRACIGLRFAGLVPECGPHRPRPSLYRTPLRTSADVRKGVVPRGAVRGGGARGGGARDFWGDFRGGGARDFWGDFRGSTRNFRASWPIATYVQTTAIRSGAPPRRNHHADLSRKFLLRPTPELTDIILGIIGKAQALCSMTIHAFVFLSTHSQFLLSPTSAGQLLG